MKLVIQLWQTGTHDPQHAATPFMIAASAAAMDVEVSIHLSSPSLNCLEILPFGVLLVLLVDSCSLTYRNLIRSVDLLMKISLLKTFI